ncbi:Helix-turn-helix domain (DUF4817) [Popillia japonica]|uniref:Helix-turn-helix domain (DUF4817) n=1 Tax=Popillia japonica TaxID=7064 RepID=A0AAW1LCP4_POPJA
MMRMQAGGEFTQEERIFLLTSYIKHDAHFQTIFAEFGQQFPNRRNVRRLYMKFQRTGSVADAPRAGRPRSMTTEANMETVALSYVEEANISARRWKPWRYPTSKRRTLALEA